MLSINTNLSSLIVQNNLNKSTNALNTAIERMTTGYKLNHAGDNAANYSIAKNMSSKLSSYEVAQDNISAGLDLISTAQDTISLMHNHGERLQALITQARNGTYGARSLEAMSQEAAALVSEINRLYISTEYNGIDLFGGITIPDTMPKAGESGFIEEAHEYDDEWVETLTHVSDVVWNFADGEKYAISSVEDLCALAEKINSGNNHNKNCEFILSADIDLSEYCLENDWQPIGDPELVQNEVNQSRQFSSHFNGNGHTISNLKINETSKNYVGLFGCIDRSASIKNLRVEGDVSGNWNVGLIAGNLENNAVIQNCSAFGTVTGDQYVGGIVGDTYSYDVNCNLTNCYTSCNVTGNLAVGGIAGMCNEIDNCYSTGNVTGNQSVGGLTGSGKNVTNSYVTGNVSGNEWVGGLVGTASGNGQIQNCIQAGQVSGTSNVGALVGNSPLFIDPSTISNQEFIFSQLGISTMEEFCAWVENFGGIEGFNAIFGCSATTYEELIDPFAEFLRANAGGADDDSITVTDCVCSLSAGLKAVGYGTPKITNLETHNSSVTLQVGINGDDSSRIAIVTGFSFNLDSVVDNLTGSSAYDTINDFLNNLSNIATQLGSASNRLESALESTTISINNLTKSRSTIQDADIAQVSSEYIRHQILQQASATLLATANQSPAIALQLI